MLPVLRNMNPLMLLIQARWVADTPCERAAVYSRHGSISNILGMRKLDNDPDNDLDKMCLMRLLSRRTLIR
jgi:hypothetical protein